MQLDKTYDPHKVEDKWYAHWLEQGYFHGDSSRGGKPYCIVIPPPNVTGILHMGHALNNTIQDVLIRWRRMQGRNTVWVPGTDHAGIATQNVVERELKKEGKTRDDLGREAFLERVWQWREVYGKTITNQLKKLGASCDWDRKRFTIDEGLSNAVSEVFIRLYKKGYIYRGNYIIHWCPRCHTALSDEESEHKEVSGKLYYIRYPIKDTENDYVVVATTRPETLLGDAAVAIHPEDTRYNHLTDQPLLLPILNRELPIVQDDFVDPTFGTGAVKVTPAHDPNDYEVAKRCDLPMINIMNRDGTLNVETGVYSGLTMKQARKKVVEDLDALQLLDTVEDREIELPQSDRSKTPIEPYLADQWFVAMSELSQSAIDAVIEEKVSITPKRYERGYLDWLGEKRDWPVSRQLWWGHQIPVWTKACTAEAEVQPLIDAIHALPGFDEMVAAVQLEPCEETDSDKRAKLELPFASVHVCVQSGCEEFENALEEIGLTREEDVLDTWFSSALWPHSTLGWPEQTPELACFYPTSTLITSRDIISLWVARMVLMGLNNCGEVPFDKVYIHPKIQDGFGETMSKSKGNGIDPLDVIAKFGADALRFGMAHLCTETQDVRLPVQFECPHCQHSFDQTKKNRILPRVACPSCKKEFSTQWAESEEDKALEKGAVISERFETARNFVNKLWNASRFAMLNLEGYEASPISEEDLTVEDRWMLSRLTTVSGNVTAWLEEFKYADATRELYEFAWHQFCSFYVEMLKDRFADESKRPHAQRMLAYSLDCLLRLKQVQT